MAVVVAVGIGGRVGIDGRDTPATVAPDGPIHAGIEPKPMTADDRPGSVAGNEGESTDVGSDDSERNDGESDDTGGDTFGVGIQVTESEFRFVVHVPAEIDSGWTDPDAFQRQIERYTWEQLDKRETFGAVTEVATAGETVTLGTVTMRPDGTVTASSLSVPAE